MFKLFKKVFKPDLKERFSTNDLLSETTFSGGIFIANKDNNYILVQWIDDSVESIDDSILSTVVYLV